MKKFLTILVLGLLWCNAASTASLCEKYPDNPNYKKKINSPLNDYLKEGYKITSLIDD